MELHISRQSGLKYDLHHSPFSERGKLRLGNLRQIRDLVKKINDKRNEIHQPGDFAAAGELFAMGLINEIVRLVTQAYKQDVDTSLFADCLGWLEQKVGPKKLTSVLRCFAEEFSISEVEGENPEGELRVQEGEDGSSDSEIMLEEMFFLALANQNPAFNPARELFDDSHLDDGSDYRTVLAEMELYFRSRPGFGPDGLCLPDLLRAPVRFSPGSLSGQLRYIAANWADLLTRMGFDLSRLLLGQDVLREEEKLRGAGPGPATVITYSEEDEERFSKDSHWMPRLVMMAKNTLVWLNQLSEKYSRPISRLDQIPDEELDRLADRGFTGLWLIGLWERSPASRRIKQLCGNPEAEASAYSLKEYRPAGALGGDTALEDLKERCMQRGIRLACDMVPNHTGLDSTWMIEHPEWFLSRPDCPYPNYSFGGENLSGCEEISVRIEDHYFDRTDAAVVFEREDLRTGEVRYIYHGNDGTSMPWNDTAQLNYLNPDLRRAVMETILGVARRFPIIRFDAAMTLAKRHFRRLWFPEPGSGGDIPSRAEAGLSQAEFERAFPVEFWREVADRIAAEAPDTLLLAEAFWMMEGYFVRTLGMHRVYNSAFMNMLKMEENGNFRKMLKNTLEFDPEILKRYVNFMSNPDEESAARQFGKGDKYLGVCVLMATLPGLPMFAHGQIEGFEEKYGMEYTRAYWQEDEDDQLIRIHENVIFPLLHKRRNFAEVENFYLFDLHTSGDEVNENVIAYSNSWQGEKNLVVYNNRYDKAAGWIKTSATFLDKHRPGGPRLQQKLLSDILGLSPGEDKFVILQDAVCGKEYLRRADELIQKGLYLELDGYECHVFTNFRLVTDSSIQLYSTLCTRLDGKGVLNMETAVEEYLLLPLHNAFKKCFNPTTLKHFIQDHSTTLSWENAVSRSPEPDLESREFLSELEKFSGQRVSELAARHLQETLRAVKQMKELLEDTETADLPPVSALAEFWGRPRSKALIQSWICTRNISDFFHYGEESSPGQLFLHTLRLGPVIETALREIGLTDQETWLTGKLLPVMIDLEDALGESKPESHSSVTLFRSLFKKEAVCELLGMNTFEGVEFFNQESFEALTEIIYFLGLIRLLNENQKITSALLTAFGDLHAQYLAWERAGSAAGYRTAQFLSNLKGNH